MITIERLRCSGTNRAHLIDIARLVNPREFAGGGAPSIEADGPCPVCGSGWTTSHGQLAPAGRVALYEKVGVKGTRTNRKCNAACLASATVVCKCACGGANHGMAA